MSALAWVTGSGSSRFTPGLPRLQHLKVCSWHSPPKKDKKRGLEKKATFFNETTFSSFFFFEGGRSVYTNCIKLQLYCFA